MAKLQIPLLYLPDHDRKKITDIGVFKLGKPIYKVWLNPKIRNLIIKYLQN